MKVSTETMREIWIDDDPGAEHYEVGPDRDSLGCVEIRMRDAKDNKIIDRMTFNPTLALQIADAMIKCAYELTEPKGD